MPVYIEKSGDLVGCYHSGTDGQTNKHKGKIGLLSHWTMEGWDEQYLSKFCNRSYPDLSFGKLLKKSGCKIWQHRQCCTSHLIISLESNNKCRFSRFQAKKRASNGQTGLCHLSYNLLSGINHEWFWSEPNKAPLTNRIILPVLPMISKSSRPSSMREI